MSVNWREIETKWQLEWEKAKIFEAEPDPSKPKYFVTVAYPYPNSPQHIGHGRSYTLADVHARYKRMNGYNVLFPMGFHYTGTPILAMAKRVRAGDEELTSTFTNTYRVPSEIFKEFTDPIKIAQYFHEEIKKGMKRIGYSIDFRREFTTIDPQYSRFIEWQFHKLSELRFISRGSHAVGWCPSCGNPVGQHDTMGDVEPEIEEFVLIKFEYDGYFLPAGTLRAETVFGVTNIWLNPDAEYVKAKVNGEKLIVSKNYVEKLRYLNREVEPETSFPGKTLVGKHAVNPLTGAKLPIFPASFVDPNNVTGVVMSVPAHAPYDYIALEDMKKHPADFKDYSITPDDIDKVKPISIISLPEYSEFPAADVIHKLKINNQNDLHLEEATKEVYRHEFHNGHMNENTGEYRGLAVAEAKEKVKEDLISRGKVFIMPELVNRPVFCRCGTECVVKIFENQWFLNYGNQGWKKLASECINEMDVLPNEIRNEFDYVVNWLREKACARKSGLGTTLPWDSEWIIESLSDSTIYMAYYLIAKFVNEHKIPASQLSDTVFDYLLLGKGEVKKLSEGSGLSQSILEEMRNEFNYFYPLDSRHSGRDLISNHLTYFIFNHVALFPKALWPRQIVVNGSVLMEGQKMSKSLGNIIPLGEAINTYGADPLRISLVSTAGLLQDADFSVNLAISMGEWLKRLYNHALKVLEMKKAEDDYSTKLTWIDRWIRSRLQGHIKTVTDAMDRLEVMKACQYALYLLDQDVQWYMRRVKEKLDDETRSIVVANVLREALDVQVKMLAPFVPHLCEEIWHIIGNQNFITLAPWPTYQEEKVDAKAEGMENYLQSVMEDTKSILKAVGISPKKIFYYTAADWKWKAYTQILKESKSDSFSFELLMKTFSNTPEMKQWMSQLPKFAKKLSVEVSRMPPDLLDRRIESDVLDELEFLKAAKGFIEREFNAEVEVCGECSPNIYDPKGRSGIAEPYRPGIFVE
ncbi:MAG: leucine--tRNA ligase [Candidatus Bathyarchaeota archaeon]